MVGVVILRLVQSISLFIDPAGTPIDVSGEPINGRRFDKELNKGSVEILTDSCPVAVRKATSVEISVPLPVTRLPVFANLASAPAVKKSLLLELRFVKVLYPKPIAYSPRPNVVALPVIALADNTLFLILTTGLLLPIASEKLGCVPPENVPDILTLLK